MKELRCPRCGQTALGTASRRGRCTSCGAPLTTGATPNEDEVRAYLYGHHRLQLPPLRSWPVRGRPHYR